MSDLLLLLLEAQTSLKETNEKEIQYILVLCLFRLIVFELKNFLLNNLDGVDVFLRYINIPNIPHKHFENKS